MGQRLLWRLRCKESAQKAGDPDQSVCREDPLKEKIANHFNILDWRIPQIQEVGGDRAHKDAKSQTQLKHLSCTNT